MKLFLAFVFIVTLASCCPITAPWVGSCPDRGSKAPPPKDCFELACSPGKVCEMDKGKPKCVPACPAGQVWHPHGGPHQTSGCVPAPSPSPTPSSPEALDYFNAEIARLRGSERIFLGAQPGPSDEADAYAWTKCVPTSKVFVVQASAKLLTMPRERVRFAAAHEVAHVRLHARILCSGIYPGMSLARKREMEGEADRCAQIILAGGGLCR